MSPLQTESLLTTPLNAPQAQLDAVLHHAAFAPIEGVGWLRVTGEDRVRWLTGMVTNSIQELSPGQGNYSFALSAQGRIQADCTAFAEPDAILIESNRAASLATLLDRFIIMDDVELSILAPEEDSVTRSLTLAGPQAEALLATLGLKAGPEMSLQHTTWHGRPVDLIHAYSPLVPRYELWATPEIIEGLGASLAGAGATAAGSHALHTLRVLEGTPLFGTDIRERDLPQETAPPNGQSRALHFAKGCYLGQEIVERIRSRGAVHRTFTAFALTGAPPAAGATLHADEDVAVGELTSVAALPDGRIFALGYIRRAALESGRQLHYRQPAEGVHGLAKPVAAPIRLNGT